MNRSDSGIYLAVVPDNIDCDFAEVLISRRLDGELAPEDVPLLESHLKNCSACREREAEWFGHAVLLKESLSTLVPEKKQRATRRRSPLWVPVGMVASQAAALLALAVYLNFIATPAQAPKLSSAPQQQPAPAAQPAPAQAEDTEVPLPTDLLPESDAVAQNVTHPIEEEQRHLFKDAPIERPADIQKEPAPLAAMREVIIPRLIPNVSIEYTLRGSDGGREISGRMDILGDILNDRAVIRIRDSRSGLKEVAQADINTLLAADERAVARRLVAACKTAELRSRFEEIIRKSQR
ncbi:MAG TPA: zf-HC2 domain-containing protein [Planctomycetota bacterium]|nr:zf-HC2 domain-containing protein [Planctomycetota bacterium]